MMLVSDKSTNYFFAKETYSMQDTLLSKKELTDTLKDGNNDELLNIKSINTVDLQAIDSILKVSEAREQQIKLQQQKDSIAKQLVYRKKIDTTELFYKEFGIASFPITKELEKDLLNQNFLLHFRDVKPIEQKTDQVFTYVSEHANETNAMKVVEKGNPQQASQQLQFDWITFLLIGVFLLIGWVRLFNKKYIGALVKSILSYNESYTLFREKNSLMERASFILNTVFVATISLFILQVTLYSNLQIWNIQNQTEYLMFCGSFIALYILRYLSARFIGHIFLKQKVFSEYLHNVNNATKVTGLFLLPIVVSLQYLALEYMLAIIWVGVFIIGFIYLLQQLRAFQILIRNNVSILYMILYLCAFEITPFLIVYKLLLS